MMMKLQRVVLPTSVSDNVLMDTLIVFFLPFRGTEQTIFQVLSSSPTDTPCLLSFRETGRIMYFESPLILSYPCVIGAEVEAEKKKS